MPVHPEVVSKWLAGRASWLQIAPPIRDLAPIDLRAAIGRLREANFRVDHEKIFFAPTASSQAAGGAFIERLAHRKEDLDTASGPDVAAAQIAAFREWEQPTAACFADLKSIQQPTLVVNGIHDDTIPIANSYRLIETFRTLSFSSIRTPGTGLCFSITSRSRDRHQHFSHRTLLFAPY
jgi:pimeloyl-ACP methyl ester carboxylesterase